MEAQVKLEHSLLAIEREHEVHAMLELAASDLADAEERASLRLALVLDRSGSMAGPKLEAVRRCAHWLVERLRPTDELALIDYDDVVRVLSPLAPVDKPALHERLARIYAGGMTNLSGGWLEARAELLRSPGGAPRKIILLTDGLANVGITDPERLVGLARVAHSEGIGTSTIGFGEGFDEDLLTQLADAGGGNAHYAPTPDAAAGIFAEELDGLTSLVAQNVTVEITPSSDVDLLGVLNDYPVTAVAGGVRLALGDAYAGDTRRVVLALRVPRLGELGTTKIAELAVRYVSVSEEIAERTLTVPVAVNLVSADEAAAANADLEVREEVQILRAARARDEAIELADDGDFDGAQQRLHVASLELRTDASPQLDAEADLLDGMRAQVELSSWNQTRKQLRYAAQSRRRNRTNPSKETR